MKRLFCFVLCFVFLKIIINYHFKNKKSQKSLCARKDHVNKTLSEQCLVGPLVSFTRIIHAADKFLDHQRLLSCRIVCSRTNKIPVAIFDFKFLAQFSFGSFRRVGPELPRDENIINEKSILPTTHFNGLTHRCAKGRTKRTTARRILLKMRKKKNKEKN